MQALYTTTSINMAGIFNKELTINSEQRSQHVIFDTKNGTLVIKGDATHQEITDHLISVIKLVNEYLKVNDQLTCSLSLNKFNTSTCKILFNLFKMLQQHKRNHKNINVNWFVEFDYDEMIDIGLDFAGIYDLNFNVQYA